MMELKGKMITDEEVLEELAARCRKDDVFRANLRKNTMATLEGLGIIVPEGMTVQVTGDTSETECLCLGQADELTDEDLDKVAGGLANFNTSGITGLQVGTLSGIRPAIMLYGVI